MQGKKHYWEATLDYGYSILGIGSDILLDKYAGYTASSYGWSSSTAGLYTDRQNGAPYPTFMNYDASDRVMIAFDSGAGKLWFGVNGQWQGNPAAGTGEQFSGITGSQYPAVSVYNGQGTIFFQPKQLLYSPPAGFVISEVEQ